MEVEDLEPYKGQTDAGAQMPHFGSPVSSRGNV